MPGESQRTERQVLELVLSHLKGFRYINDDEARKLKAWCKKLIATSEMSDALENEDPSVVTEVRPDTSAAGTLRKDWRFPRDGISYTIRNHSRTKTYYVSVSIQEVRPD